MIKYLWLSLLFCTIQMQCNELNHISNIIDLYSRPITFLGICDNNDNVLDVLARKYPLSTFVLLNETSINPSNVASNFIKLDTKPDTNIIKHLGECEHFDLVYVQNHFESKFDYAQALYHIGENVIVAVPNDNSTLIPFLKLYDFHEITVEDNISYFISTKSIPFLKRTQWLEAASDLNSVRHIESSYSKKMLYKRYEPNFTPSEWIAGINLITFKVLSGSIPNRDQLRQNISEVFNIPHLDLMPNNMVLTGNRLALIDFDPPGTEARTVKTPEMLNLLQAFAECNTEEVVRKFNALLLYSQQQIHPNKAIEYQSKTSQDIFKYVEYMNDFFYTY